MIGPDRSGLSFPPYRMVWNKSTGELTITAASVGFDATLNDTAGTLFAKLSQFSSEDRVLFDAEESAFADDCRGYGWLTDDGHINGSFRAVDKDPLLRTVQIELSLRCNLSCSYCYSESGPHRSDHLSADDVCRILADAEEMGVTWIDFTGGEFFLFREWQTVLHRARSLGLVVSLHTNGILLTERNVDFIVASGVRHIQVSADSHIAEVHDRARGSRGAFDRLVKGIQVARSRGVDVTVSLIAHRENKQHFVEAAQWFAGLGTKVILDRVVRVGGELHVGMGISTAEFYETVAPLVADSRIRAGKICQTAGSAGGRVEPDCGVAHSFVYVTAGGEYALCPTMTSREEAMFAGPLVSEMSLQDAWERSELFNRLRYINCENTGRCPAASACGGGCRSNAYIDGGRLDAPDVLSCNMNKNGGLTFLDFPTRYAAGHFS
jgi:AdoMet-dependent heme synthase